jgi:hypothetical protein
MNQPASSDPKKIVLTYTDNGGDDLDIRLDSEGFGGDVEMVTIYLHKTMQAILNSEETATE